VRLFSFADHFKDQNTLSNRSLQNPQELLLFHRLLAAYGEDAEGVKLCKDERLGPTSKIAKDEWIFRRKQLELLENHNEWQEIFDTTLKLLSMARANNDTGAIVDARGADWAVWKAFLRSVSELQSEG
jgi:N-terminal acetyltransferase B complex non-catalytic subunit